MPAPREDTPPARDRIVDAADDLLRSVGLAHTTTRAIAEHANCSEAALYKHFASKEDLFITVLAERMPPLAPVLAAIDIDDGDLEASMATLAAAATRFYEASLPVAASLFAEPSLLARHRDAMAELEAGPHVPIEVLGEVLRRAREHGRLRSDADVDTAARLLFGACFQRAFLAHATPASALQPDVEAFSRDVAATVLRAIE